MNSVSAPVMAAGQQTDALSRSLQKQIEEAKKKLQELASDKNMSDEEKMQKRQELQKKIAELNQQLKQHQMEQKRNSGGGLSTGSMQSMISADSSMKQARVQGRAATEMKGREGVLEIEIKLDSARAGGEGSLKGVDAKKEQLAETRARRMNVESAQMQTLTEANEEAQKAAEEQADAGKTGEKQREETAVKAESEKEEERILSERQEKEAERRYTHMDVRL